jgi:hypothetical protein
MSGVQPSKGCGAPPWPDGSGQIDCSSSQAALGGQAEQGAALCYQPLSHSMPCGPCTQTLYESSVAFGMRKALQTEAGKGELEAQVAALSEEKRELERQVRVAGS